MIVAIATVMRAASALWLIGNGGQEREQNHLPSHLRHGHPDGRAGK
jgi:hypothetical protein